MVHQGDFGALCEPSRRRKALDGTCDGYMWRRGGAEKRTSLKIMVFACFLEGQSVHGDSREEFQSSEPDRPGGGRGRVNPPPCGLV